MGNENDIPTLKQLCFNYLLRNHDKIPKKVLQIYEITDIREEFISLAKRKHLVDDQFFKIFGEIFILSNSNIIHNIQNTNNFSQNLQNTTTTNNSSSPVTNQNSIASINSNNNGGGSNSFDDDNNNHLEQSNIDSLSPNNNNNVNNNISDNLTNNSNNSSNNSITSLNLELEQIKDIDLSGLPRITDISIQNLAQYNHLQNLELSFCTGVSSDFLKHLAQNRKIQLQYLNLYYTNINDQTIASVATHYPNIKSLLVGGCQLLTDQCVKSLLKLQNLHHLDVSHCKKLTTSAIKTLALPQLQLLNASWCIEVSSSDATYYKVAKGCPKLTCLQIAASNVSEYQLAKILQESKNLISLDISYCGIAITSVDSKVFKYLNNIQQLILAGCQFKEPILRKILEQTPNLRELDLSSQTALPWSLVDWIIKDSKLLTHLRLLNFSFSKFDRFDQDAFSMVQSLTVYLPSL
ncbi:hypothetical protein DLAC_03780 [Tieghemostelium lacteum]|uniref:F-box/LRR-repeat protein 15-like leucin rich repeat domain-containing protein n=1 Tax=Tieghemostelium lacteum TaxID=361077 RepID=A0A152A0V2_TIELA|nr:hypothetical protein DLAC_03780 [Tieghemostelium lacteum]|eukprot:KYQ99828.1 hypothetical protein DLAC_03780 [Tieghemostelium lacteum]